MNNSYLHPTLSSSLLFAYNSLSVSVCPIFCLFVYVSISLPLLQDLYGVRSDLGNLYKALGRLEDAKVI